MVLMSVDKSMLYIAQVMFGPKVLHYALYSENFMSRIFYNFVFKKNCDKNYIDCYLNIKYFSQ